MREGGNEETNTIRCEWEEIELAADSGATDNVVGGRMLTSTETVPNEKSKKGAKREVADGTLIENQGEKKAMAETVAGIAKALTIQVTDVNKALVSVSQIVQNGHQVALEEGSSYIEDKHAGARIAAKEGEACIC